LEKAALEKGIAAVAGGFLLPVFEFLYGQGPAVVSTMTALAFFIVMDWLSGSRAARRDNTYASRYGIDGIFRTFFMLLLPAGGHLLDVVIGLPGVLFGVFAVGLLYHTIKSMTANAIRAGWADWLPISILEKVTEWVQSEIESKIDRALKRKAEREGGNETS
jgi:phage-related holin